MSDEVSLGDGLCSASGQVSQETWKSWEGFLDVHQDALLVPRSIIPLEFQYTRKSSLRSFSELARIERHNRSRYGYIIPYQHVHFGCVTDVAREGLFVPVSRWWRELEVPEAATPSCFQSSRFSRVSSGILGSQGVVSPFKRSGLRALPHTFCGKRMKTSAFGSCR